MVSQMDEGHFCRGSFYTVRVLLTPTTCSPVAYTTPAAKSDSEEDKVSKVGATLTGSILELNTALVSAAAHLCCCISLSLPSELRLTAPRRRRLQNRSNPFIGNVCLHKLLRQRSKNAKAVFLHARARARTCERAVYTLHVGIVAKQTPLFYITFSYATPAWLAGNEWQEVVLPLRCLRINSRGKVIINLDTEMKAHSFPNRP